MHALAHILGMDNASGDWYLAWSGWVGDLGLFGGIVVLYHKHNCHQRHCWRVGRHIHDGTPYCTRHRPAREGNR